MTLDLAMPGLDGIGVLKALKSGAADAVPVVVVSAFSPAHGARAVDALAEGAFDLAAKPAVGEPFDTFMTELAEKIELAAQSGARRRAPLQRVAPAAGRPVRRRPSAGAKRVVVIACSTGGPKALGRLVPQLPSPLGAGGYIVQHMPPGFTRSLAARLDGASKLAIREAAGGEALEPGTLLMAAGGSHLRLSADRRATLSSERLATDGGLCPRADYTIEDVAKLYGSRTLLVVLTGMGRDGVEGARAVKREGGVVLAEAESTCTVYGMPRAVVDAGLADEVLALNELPAAIAREAGA
jgi:two-component system chemotaxis response regulator CheB